MTSSPQESERRLEGLHPWLKPDLEATRGFAYTDSWLLAAPPHEIWPLISDTSRLNRALRIPKATFDEVAGRRTGVSKYFRWAFRWDEPPWDWVAEQVIVCRKSFSSGPVRSVAAILALEPVDEGKTRLTVWYGWTPKGLVGKLAVPRITAYLRVSYEQLLPQVEEWVRDHHDPTSWPLLRRRPSVPPDRVSLVEHATRSLVARGCRPTVVTALLEHLVCGDPMDLDRVRPFALAGSLGLPRRETLRTALELTKEGLLWVRWDVLCPHCRGTRTSLARLDDLSPEARCEACDVVFQTTAERLELTFRCHERLRHIEPRVYCAAEAALKPHVRLQLGVGDALTVQPSLRSGRYLVRTADFATRIPLTVDEHGADAGVADGTALHLAPGATLDLPATDSRWLIEALWNDQEAVRPTDVLSMAAYREVMGDERLGTDMALEMGDQALLFTDLVASTQLYRQLGDVAAFRAVSAHFAVVSDLVKAEGGAVIKTIGDAVMAAFTTPEAAARAAEQLAQTDFGDLQIRVSLHSGRCIAVALDTGVDYFGSVVNEAAKLQSAAGAQQVAISEALAETLGIEGDAVTYRSGGDERVAVVWSPGAAGATPAPVRRRDE